MERCTRPDRLRASRLRAGGSPSAPWPPGLCPEGQPELRAAELAAGSPASPRSDDAPTVSPDDNSAPRGSPIYEGVIR
jgi:hypothetical protein